MAPPPRAPARQPQSLMNQSLNQSVINISPEANEYEPVQNDGLIGTDFDIIQNPLFEGEEGAGYTIIQSSR